MNFRKNCLSAISIIDLFIILFFPSSIVSENNSPSKMNALADTYWKLEFIEVSKGNVFSDTLGSKWVVPQNQSYTIGFVGDSIVVNETICANIVTCMGNYKLTSQDSILIKVSCSTIPRPPCCERTLEYMAITRNVRGFQIVEESLRLYYNDSTNNVKGELLVKFVENAAVDSILTEKKFTTLNIKLKKCFPNLGICHLRFNTWDKTDEEILSIFKNDNRILTAQLNHLVTQRSINIENTIILHYNRIK